MIVAVDNSILTLILYPQAKATPNPATGKPVDDLASRLKSMITRHEENGDTIIIPTPVLTETFISLNSDPSILLDKLSALSVFHLYPFDMRAALMLAKLSNSEISKSERRRGIAPYQKVKFDRQIVSIALVADAEVLYTDDKSQSYFAESAGLKVVHSWDLDIADRFRQKDFKDDHGDDSSWGD